MAIKQAPELRSIDVGDTVSVKAFRQVPVFVGKVTLAQGSFFNVRAPDGREWHRNFRDISLIRKAS